MLVLYVGMKYDYGIEERGYSFEHYNFYECLRSMGHDILYFDFMTLMQQRGQLCMNRRLQDVVATEKPTLMFSVLFKDELDPMVLRNISESGKCITVNWFCDDHWRFENYSRHWAPSFNWCVTTAANAMPKYAALGYDNVIKSQWACNHYLYRKLDVPLRFDVGFVGQDHGNRRQVIGALRKAGINVNVWGTGWEDGRISQEKMIEVFNGCRINLNLGNASDPVLTQGLRVERWLRKRASWVCDRVPYGGRLKGMGNTGLDAMKQHTEALGFKWEQYAEQIKGRNFEVPGCGGFILTAQAEDLDMYYSIDREVACFTDVKDLVKKVSYYLAHEEERRAIADAGYKRTLTSHTYVHRFQDIFSRIGLPSERSTGTPDISRSLGQTIEVH